MKTSLSLVRSAIQRVMIPAAMLVATLPFFSSQAQETQRAGAYSGAATWVPEGGLGLGPRAEQLRGALASIQVSSTGACSLRLNFLRKQIRRVGQFAPDTREPGTTDAYLADLGPWGEGTRLWVLGQPSGILLFVVNEDGSFVDSIVYLFPAKRPEAGPLPWNTVHMTADAEAEYTNDEIMLGTGYGGLRVGRTGNSSFAGMLPDGQGVTAGGVLVEMLTGEGVPMMMRTASGRDTVTGLMFLEGDELGPEMFDSFRWTKGPSLADRFDPEGWTRWVATNAAPYTPPGAGQKLFFGAESSPPNTRIGFYGANRVRAPEWGYFLQHDFFTNAAHRAVTPAGLNLHFFARTGFFSGSFVLAEPPRLAVRVPFSGMLKRVQNAAESERPSYTRGLGFFLTRPPEGGLDVPVVSGQVGIDAIFPPEE